MVAGLLLFVWADHWLDRVNISETFWSGLFGGRSHFPAGVLMLVLFLIVIPLGARELCRIFRAKGIDADVTMIALAGVLGCLLCYAVPHQVNAPLTAAIFASVFVLVFVAALAKHSVAAKRSQGAVAVAAVTLFALIYMGLLPGFYLAIRRWHSSWLLLAIILVIKSCDIGAYFTGMAFGRHKLIPWLSPGKTWEGLIGGTLTAALVAAALAGLNSWLEPALVWQMGPRTFVPMRLPLWWAALAGGLLGLVGQVGDLIASLFKRDAGMKDSGRSIPGFGGVMDVVDSPLIAAPVAYWLLEVAHALK